jgi:uncharacterized protein (DUF2249 family)
MNIFFYNIENIFNSKRRWICMDKVTVDVRGMAPQKRHGYIFDTFNGLKPGEVMELINDHDPKPLWYQMSAEMAGQFEWAYIEEGPEDWRVDIRKLSPGDNNFKNSTDDTITPIH